MPDAAPIRTYATRLPGVQTPVVALPRSQSLLLSAKHLLLAAKVRSA